MKRWLAVATLALSGCMAYMTPRGIVLEPVAEITVGGPPVIVEPEGLFTVQPLPPVIVVPDRRLYYYDSVYYYTWGDAWYYSRYRRGPWHRLPREYWPSRQERDDEIRRRGGPGRRGGGGLERR